MDRSAFKDLCRGEKWKRTYLITKHPLYSLFCEISKGERVRIVNYNIREGVISVETLDGNRKISSSPYHNFLIS